MNVECFLDTNVLISYRDGAILAAAAIARAPLVYTEDLNHGQAYGSVRVLNPFRED